jgi:ABC-type phosphate transport system substrate-binding protein
MDMSLQKRFAPSPRTLLLSLSVLGCCVFVSLVRADASLAAVPTAGNACVASDGKVTGRGASYQAHAETFFIEKYDQLCGPVVSQGASDPTENSGKGMLAYNYPADESVVGFTGTGAGAGLKAAICRTDAYAGDSLPYTEAQLAELNAAPTTGTKACTIPFDPPFAPQVSPNGKGEFEYANSNDVQAKVMSVPVAGTATSIPVNLAGVCSNGTPTSLEFNAQEVSRIFGGDAKNWNDTELVSNNSELSSDNCTGPITRAVRPDSAGTTEIFKSYLVGSVNTRPGTLTCDVTKTWKEYTSPNTIWPGKAPESATGCSPIIVSAKSGGPAEVELVQATNGSVGYADLPDAAANDVGLILPTVESATLTQSYQAPNKGKAANCNFNSLTLPGLTANEAVGLNTSENWATNSPVNHQNATNLGSAYPICGITFDLVYTGLDNNSNTNNAITPLTADQRRTLYGYFTSTVLSSYGQSGLSSIFYAPLPSGWLPTLEAGFQANF